MTPNLSLPPFAALWHKARGIMDVVLHLGAHRTATTSFQRYLRANRTALEAQGIGFWGPLRTRNGAFAGIIPEQGLAAPDAQFAKARGRIAMQLAQAQARGIRTLVVSDENMLGTMRHNIRLSSLYCGAGERMARFFAAFDGRVTRVSIGIRSLERWWASVFSSVVPRGEGVPSKAKLVHIAEANRSWRDLVTDISCAMPEVEIQVLPYETFGSRPELKLWHMNGEQGVEREQIPMKDARFWANKSPDLGTLRTLLAGRTDAISLPQNEGRWNMFSQQQEESLRETYADDIFWLAAGADGLASLKTQTHPIQNGINPTIGQTTRGQKNDHEQGHLARSG